MSSAFQQAAVSPAFSTVTGQPTDNANLAAQLLKMPTWVKVNVTYLQFSTAGLTNDISLYTLPIKGIIHEVQIIPTTAFAGGAIATYTLSVGIVGSPTKYCAAKNVFTGFTLPTLATTAGIESSSGTTDIRIYATSTVANLSAATAGVADIYILTSVLP